VANLPACTIGRQRPDCRSGGTCELANDVTVYLVEEDFGKRPGLPRDARRRGGPRDDHPELHLRAVAAFNTAEGWSRYGSEDIAFEVLDQAYDANDCKSAISWA
jgi:hypothetical protein